MRRVILKFKWDYKVGMHKIIFILALASVICIDFVYADNIGLTTDLRIPLYSQKKDKRIKKLLAGIVKQKRHRTDEEISSDRARLKELLDQGKHTVKELANLTGEDEIAIRNDINLTLVLKSHPNLIIIEYRTDGEISSDRARLKELLDHGKHTVKELADLTGKDKMTVRSDIDRTLVLKGHPNLIIAELEYRTDEERSSDRARLKELLDQGKHTVKELADLTGKDKMTVRSDINLTLVLKSHPNLIMEYRTDEERSSDRAMLKELLDQGKHTVKELANLTGEDEIAIRNDIDRTLGLKGHPNLIIAKSRKSLLPVQRNKHARENL